MAYAAHIDNYDSVDGDMVGYDVVVVDRNDCTIAADVLGVSVGVVAVADDDTSAKAVTSVSVVVVSAHWWQSKHSPQRCWQLVQPLQRPPLVPAAAAAEVPAALRQQLVLLLLLGPLSPQALRSAPRLAHCHSGCDTLHWPQRRRACQQHFVDGNVLTLVVELAAVVAALAMTELFAVVAAVMAVVVVVVVGAPDNPRLRYFRCSGVCEFHLGWSQSQQFATRKPHQRSSSQH